MNYFTINLYREQKSHRSTIFIKSGNKKNKSFFFKFHISFIKIKKILLYRIQFIQNQEHLLNKKEIHASNVIKTKI